MSASVRFVAVSEAIFWLNAHSFRIDDYLISCKSIEHGMCKHRNDFSQLSSIGPVKCITYHLFFFSLSCLTFWYFSLSFVHTIRLATLTRNDQWRTRARINQSTLIKWLSLNWPSSVLLFKNVMKLSAWTTLDTRKISINELTNAMNE